LCRIFGSLPGLAGPALKGMMIDREHTAVRGDPQRAGSCSDPAPDGMLASFDGLDPNERCAKIMGPEWIIVGVIAVAVLFGAKKIPDIARNVGRAQGEFKKGMHEGNVGDAEPSPPAQATPPASAPPAQAGSPPDQPPAE
jgi:sec-independent protein translocase protein TatA